jgi:hypothetical protein
LGTVLTPIDELELILVEGPPVILVPAAQLIPEQDEALDDEKWNGKADD